mmetsp:Transcript_89811/g.269924  ORF Transcript_89811/g.269924 Transcript_89811/m.269924 type:complete len:207 (-) Transcript_89811:51-671(-)
MVSPGCSTTSTTEAPCVAHQRFARAAPCTANSRSKDPKSSQLRSKLSTLQPVVTTSTEQEPFCSPRARMSLTRCATTSAEKCRPRTPPTVPSSEKLELARSGGHRFNTTTRRACWGCVRDISPVGSDAPRRRPTGAILWRRAKKCRQADTARGPEKNAPQWPDNAMPDFASTGSCRLHECGQERRTTLPKHQGASDSGNWCRALAR